VKRDWSLTFLHFILWATFVLCGLVVVARTWIAVPLRPEEQLIPLYCLLSAGFLAVIRLQAWAAARTIEAIEASKPTPDELAEALRAAARKAKTITADGAQPPPVPTR
jgi:hypothetical protein